MSSAGGLASMIADIPLDGDRGAGGLAGRMLPDPAQPHAPRPDGAARERWYDWPSRQVNRGFAWVRERLFRPFMRLVVPGAIRCWPGWCCCWPAGGQLHPRRGDLALLRRARTGHAQRQLRDVRRCHARRHPGDDARAAARRRRAVRPAGGRARPLAGRPHAGRDRRQCRPRAGAGREPRADHLGSITIDLIDADLRPYSSFEFTAMLQDEVRNHPLLDEISFRSFGMGPGGDSLSVQTCRRRHRDAEGAAEALKVQLAPFPRSPGSRTAWPSTRKRRFWN
jgi:hypothetical protein